MAWICNADQSGARSTLGGAASSLGGAEDPSQWTARKLRAYADEGARLAEEARLGALFSECSKGQNVAALVEAASGGHRRAQCVLGQVHEAGRLGLARNREKMVELYTAAAERRVDGLVFQGDGLAEAQFRLGRAFAEGVGVRKDREMATLWLWRAAGQKHDRAAAYLHEHQKKGHPLYRVRKLLTPTKKPRAGGGGDEADATPLAFSPSADRPPPPSAAAVEAHDIVAKMQAEYEKTLSAAAPAAPFTDDIDDGEAAPPRSVRARAPTAVKEAAVGAVATLDAAAREEVEADRRARRSAAERRGRLIDVTFDDERLGVNLVLATDHRTKRKVIIVDGIRGTSPAHGVLAVGQDELVAIADDFDLPNHLLIFDEMAKYVTRRPRPLKLTFARVHAHRPAPTAKAAPLDLLAGVAPPAPADDDDFPVDADLDAVVADLDVADVEEKAGGDDADLDAATPAAPEPASKPRSPTTASDASFDEMGDASSHSSSGALAS